ncbi:hypothetical protein SeLEV6574_g01540 [Synchytrium endobioticum]|uniref:Uncharacterized protein n=1 Tax=Synchytrium endobioticum TaxID=286115 RepID=A0A507DDD0_9FUNG|nr:hypothetical protein SeLEV6574_g01540 [Synchytrium endobioticum]
MAKFTNISTLVCLAAVIILLTSARAAPAGDDNATTKARKAMQVHTTVTVRERHHAKGFTFPTHIRTHQDLACFVSEKIASMRIPLESPYTVDQLRSIPDKSMSKVQVDFTRAYHSLFFEKMKKLFRQIELTMMELRNSELLKPELDKVALELLRHYDLEGMYRKHIQQYYPVVRRIYSCKELELPNYDWERLRNKLPEKELLRVRDDPATAELIHSLCETLKNAIARRKRGMFGALPAKQCSPTKLKRYVGKEINRVVLYSFVFKKHFFEQPNDAMSEDQMVLTGLYHCVVSEKLKVLLQQIQNFMDAHGKKRGYEAALAEVERAIRKHHSLEGQYREVCERTFGDAINWPKLEPLECGGAGLECSNTMQSTPEDQTPTSHDEPISVNALGFRLGASTSQPRPCLLYGVTCGGDVDNQPPSVGVHDDPMQPGLIDFPDTTMYATSDLSLRFGYSHDDRIRLSHGGVGNELRRPPCDHVGFIGESSTALKRSTDSSRRVKVFGVFLA